MLVGRDRNDGTGACRNRDANVCWRGADYTLTVGCAPALAGAVFVYLARACPVQLLQREAREVLAMLRASGRRGYRPPVGLSTQVAVQYSKHAIVVSSAQRPTDDRT